MRPFFLAAFFFISFSSTAQLHWAFKAGGQLSTASFKRDGVKMPNENIGGYLFGIGTKVYFDDKVAFVSGLQYNSRGFTVTDTLNKPSRTYRLNYIDIPLLIQVDLSKKRNGGLYCKLGPSIGVGVNGKQTYTNAMGARVTDKAKLSVTGNYFGLFDASLNASLGYTFGGKLFAEAAYAYGIGNINNDPNGAKIKPRSASLSVGYYFR
ncbi:MAG: porin family protein [Chitinophagaceae bacterium]